VTFETDDNYSIRFKISNNSSTIRFETNNHYSHSTNGNVVSIRNCKQGSQVFA